MFFIKKKEATDFWSAASTCPLLGQVCVVLALGRDEDVVVRVVGPHEQIVVRDLLAVRQRHEGPAAIGSHRDDDLGTVFRAGAGLDPDLAAGSDDDVHRVVVVVLAEFLGAEVLPDEVVFVTGAIRVPVAQASDVYEPGVGQEPALLGGGLGPVEQSLVFGTSYEHAVPLC